MERSGEVVVSRFSFFSEKEIFSLFLISIDVTNGISAFWARRDPTDFEMKHILLLKLKIKNIFGFMGLLILSFQVEMKLNKSLYVPR